MAHSIYWSPAGIATLVFIFVAAYVWETLKWRRKPEAALEAMVTGRDWRQWKSGLRELRRRGRDIEVHVPLFLSRLLDEKRLRREAARIVLVDVYPHLRPELRAFSSADSPDATRAKLAPLFERYPLPDPRETDVTATGFVL